MGKPLDYFDIESLHSDLKGKTVRGGAYTAVAQLVRILIGLVSIPILARLLTPADVGLVAMVTVVTGFAAMFVDAGLSIATIQRENITHRQVSNLFWLAVTLGVVLAALVSVLAPLIAWFYNEPRLIGITLALVGSFVLSGLTIQHQALLRRVMQLKALAIIQIASMVVGQGLAILWAWRFQNYWSLVIMPLATALTQLVGTWIACSWRPSLPARESGVRPMIAFGANLTGFNFVNYFIRNTDKTLIGWQWGAGSLGFYAQAYKLLLIPIQLINVPLSHVAVPVLSRLADNPKQYRRTYLRFLELVLTAAVPLAAFLLVTRDWCIDLALGPQWAESAPIFGWLAIVAFTQPFGNTTGWLFVSQGRGRDMLHWGIFGGGVTIVSFLIGLPWGPTAVAASYAIVGLLVRTPILIYWVTRKGPIRVSDIIQCFYLPAALGAAVAVSIQLLRYFFPSIGSILGVFVSLGIACISWFVVLTSTDKGRAQLTSHIELLKQQFKRTPGTV